MRHDGRAGTGLLASALLRPSWLPAAGVGLVNLTRQPCELLVNLTRQPCELLHQAGQPDRAALRAPGRGVPALQAQQLAAK